MPSTRDQPERPRQEPEIIPPGNDWPDRDWPPDNRYTESRHRIYIGRIGPLGFALFVLILALFGGVLLLALIGAALIWFPVLAVLAIIAAISGLIRRL
jgi:hypothetical protein